MSIRIYGASDDLIEVDGDVYEEWSASGVDDDGVLLVVSTGHVFRIKFGDGWEIRLLVGDHSILTWSKTGDPDDGMDDVVEVVADVAWVVCDDRLEKAGARR